jgi:hypothetical protein
MIASKKAPNEPVETVVAEKPDVVESVVALYTKGVERLAEVQKKSIDLAARQNADLINSWKKFAEMAPGGPGFPMLDLAANAFERFAETQKGAIDLVVEQSHALAGLARERTSTAKEGAVSFVREMVERSVTTQKKAIDTSAAQSKAAFETAKQQFGLKGTPAEAAADSFQRGVDTLVETQKEILDIAAKPFNAVH